MNVEVEEDQAHERQVDEKEKVKIALVRMKERHQVQMKNQRKLESAYVSEGEVQ